MDRCTKNPKGVGRRQELELVDTYFPLADPDRTESASIELPSTGRRIEKVRLELIEDITPNDWSQEIENEKCTSGSKYEELGEE
jgi:hypothetical protein